MGIIQFWVYISPLRLHKYLRNNLRVFRMNTTFICEMNRLIGLYTKFLNAGVFNEESFCIKKLYMASCYQWPVRLID